jgi:TPR repeat protein
VAAIVSACVYPCSGVLGSQCGVHRQRRRFEPRHNSRELDLLRRALEPMGTAANLTSDEFKRFLGQAVAGEAEAQYVVGGAYFNGNGTQRDLAHGERWLLAAAEQGHASAQCDLGALYAEGKGVKQSYPDALKWLRKAARQGDVLAQANLGSLLAKGFRDKTVGFFQRVARTQESVDRDEAYMWFSSALKGGHASAARDLALMKTLMSADEIKAAESRAQEFLRYKLLDRPFTERLLALARRMKENFGQAVERMPETLEAKIDQAIVLVAVEITTGATSQLFGIGSANVGSLPPKLYIAGVLALVVVVSLSNETKHEGHTPAQGLGVRVISALLVLRKNEEVASLFEKSNWQLIELLKRGDQQKAKEWLDGVAALTIGYVIDDKRRKELKEKRVFTQMLKSLVDATE